MAFGVVINANSADFLEGPWKVAWYRLIGKYASHTVSCLLKLESEFHDSKLESIQKDPDEWILNLEVLKMGMGKFDQKVV